MVGQPIAVGEQGAGGRSEIGVVVVAQVGLQLAGAEGAEVTHQYRVDATREFVRVRRRVSGFVNDLEAGGELLLWSDRKGIVPGILAGAADGGPDQRRE